MSLHAQDGKRGPVSLTSAKYDLDDAVMSWHAAVHGRLSDSDTHTLAVHVPRYFGIGPEWGDLPSSRALYPFAPFGVCWVSTTALFLIYTVSICYVL